ncbi:MAG: hypothetical protein A4S14_00515 [Proteobacteria bacterium SG_bin9]|nr:MAG: hypothetical protein A4S14_00515 [Proteobacteria bacterium SG_bin9]
MARRVIRYQTNPDKADENQRYIEIVFSELERVTPSGVRYAALRLEDGLFVHLADIDNGPGLTGLASFQAFQSGLSTRISDKPLVREAVLIGNYRMIGE